MTSRMFSYFPSEDETSPSIWVKGQLVPPVSAIKRAPGCMVSDV